MMVLFFLQVHSVHQVIPVRVMGKASPIDRYIIVEGGHFVFLCQNIILGSLIFSFQIETEQRDGKKEYRPSIAHLKPILPR